MLLCTEAIFSFKDGTGHCTPESAGGRKCRVLVGTGIFGMGSGALNMSRCVGTESLVLTELFARGLHMNAECFRSALKTEEL